MLDSWVIQKTVSKPNTMYPSISSNRRMHSAAQHPPVILLLGKRRFAGDSIDAWLAESRYCALEAENAFEALEQISDFTLAERPDVVYLHVDSTDSGLEFMQTLVATAAGEPDVPIIDFAADLPTSRADFETAVAGLACQLDEFIPQHTPAKA